MRGLAEAFAAAGFSVELPRLPGHGTTVEEMKETRWADWTAEVEAAYQRLAARTERVVVAGLSMGGSLSLWTAFRHPEVAGLVLVNPATMPRPEVMEMAHGMLDEASTTCPAWPTSPILTSPRAPTTRRPCGRSRRSSRTGWRRWPTATASSRALLLLTSPQDHVVDPGNGTTWPRPTADRSSGSPRAQLPRRHARPDKDLIFDAAVTFGRKVTG
jgi:carboxylesterase